MNADPYAQRQEIIELQQRVSELTVALELVTQSRDDAKDAADSLHHELEGARAHIRIQDQMLSRLRQHIAQGLEL